MQKTLENAGQMVTDDLKKDTLRVCVTKSKEELIQQLRDEARASVEKYWNAFKGKLNNLFNWVHTVCGIMIMPRNLELKSSNEPIFVNWSDIPGVGLIFNLLMYVIVYNQRCHWISTAIENRTPRSYFSFLKISRIFDTLINFLIW